MRVSVVETAPTQLSHKGNSFYRHLRLCVYTNFPNRFSSRDRWSERDWRNFLSITEFDALATSRFELEKS